MNNKTLYFTKKDIFDSIFLALMVFIFNIVLLYTKQFGLILFLLIIIFSFLRKKDIPLFPLLTALLLVTNLFEFASLEHMPFIQLGQGIRFNLLDIITVTYLIFLWNKIVNFKHTKSKWFVNFVLISSLIYVIINFFLTFTPRGAGTNYLRILVYILFYYYFFILFEDETKIKKTLGVISVWVISATIIQIIEYFLNYRFELPGIVPFSSFYSSIGEKILTAGTEKIYLWSRVTILMFILLPFAINIYLKYKNIYFLIVSFLSILGFLISLSRIWFLGLFLIFLIIFIYSNLRLKVVFISIFIILILFLMLFQFYSLEKTGFDFLASLIGRSHSIVTLGQTYGEMDTFSVRVLIFKYSFNKFLESPLIGWGFGEKIWNNYYTVDLGMINRLVFFGIIGTGILIFYIISYILNIIRMIKLRSNKTDLTILISVLSIFVAHFPMYIWQIDFWGNAFVIPMCLIMAIGDKELLKEKEIINGGNL